MTHLLRFSLLCALVFTLSAAAANGLTGTWNFSVDLEDGQHGDPVFVLKQTGGKLTGTYRGPFGDQQVTGTVRGESISLEVVASGPAGTVKLSYSAKLESENRMSGTITRDISGSVTPGKWTATRVQ